MKNVEGYLFSKKYIQIQIVCHWASILKVKKKLTQNKCLHYRKRFSNNQTVNQ